MKAIKAFLWILVYVLIYFAIMTAVAFIGVIAVSLPSIITLIGKGAPSGGLYNAILATVKACLTVNVQNRITAASSVIAIIVFILIMRKRKKTDAFSQSFTAHPGALNIWSAALLGFFFNFIIAYIYGFILSLPALGEAAKNYNDASALLYRGDFALQVLSVAILSPIFEELFFRGLIMGKLCSVIPGSAAIVIQAAIFASFHSGPVWISYAFLCGLLMGWLCLKTRSVFTSMAFHIFFNAASFLPELFTRWDAGLYIAFAVALTEIILAITIIALNNKRDRKENSGYVDI